MAPGVTYRYVRILEVKPRLEQIVCWCEMRRAERTFSLPRIERAADGETGELIDVTAWLEDYKRSRQRTLEAERRMKRHLG